MAAVSSSTSCKLTRTARITDQRSRMLRLERLRSLSPGKKVEPPGLVQSKKVIFPRFPDQFLVTGDRYNFTLSQMRLGAWTTQDLLQMG